jgi:hypothetical protein
MPTKFLIWPFMLRCSDPAAEASADADAEIRRRESKREVAALPAVR